MLTLGCEQCMRPTDVHYSHTKVNNHGLKKKKKANKQTNADADADVRSAKCASQTHTQKIIYMLPNTALALIVESLYFLD